MSHLWNTSRFPLMAHYGGIAYPFKPGERVTIKNVKVIDRKTGGQAEVHMAEDIAAHLYADLQARGVVLIDDEHPLTDEQYQSLGNEAQIAFITGLIDDFNSLNSEIASGGGKKTLTVPPHYRELQRERLRLLTEAGDAPDGGSFMSPEELKDLQKRSEIPRAEALNRILRAVASGDTDAIMEAAKSAAGGGPDPGDFVGETPEGEFADAEPARRRARRGRPPAAAAE